MDSFSTHHPLCPEKLTPAQIAQFHHDGYLAFENVLDAAEIASAQGELYRLVTQSLQGGPDKFELKDGRRLHAREAKWFVEFEKSAPSHPTQDPREVSRDAAELRVRKLMYFCSASEALNHLARSHSRIAGVVSSLIGPDPILFQDMALVKPPYVGSEKPWHQDNAYFAVTPLESVLGVWIALDAATAANGCMHVLVGEHLGGARRHHHDRDCEILPDRIDASRAVPVELPPGGAMFFAGMLPHQTPPNSSPHRRRALQYHYRSATSQVVPRETYDKVYAEADGTPASCAAAAQDAGLPW
jgi:ectoine hydroxylase-related dioxygenase (phytanoyl-CoA dioxygenase family)